MKPRAVKGDFSCNILRIEKQLKKKKKKVACLISLDSNSGS